jgi:signal peptide peptidase SppA
MATSEMRVFSPRGVIALEPSAFGLEWAMQTQADPFCVVGKAAIVSISGPLVYQRTPENWFQTYGDIACAVRAASQAPGTDTIVLKINSPGGEVSGAFDCARDIRNIAQAAGKKLIAFTESQASSAGYALACAADQIVIADVATVGSVGVVTMMADASKLDAAMGLRFTVITSGARKADGNPHVATTDAAVQAVQATVDATAAVFFNHVSERRSVPVDAVIGLDARQFVGVAAVGVGLADVVESFSSLLGRIENPPLVSAESNAMPDDEKNDKKEDATRASLVTASESDDQDKAARAKRALAAYDSDESDDDKKKDDDKKDAAASAAVTSAVAPLARQLAAQQAELAALKAKADASDRAAIFAARKDLSPELIEGLKGTPTSSLKAVVDAIPVSAGFVNPYVAETKTPPTQGNTAQNGINPNSRMDSLMGLTKITSGTEFDGVTQTFGVKKVVGGAQ